MDPLNTKSTGNLANERAIIKARSVDSPKRSSVTNLVNSEVNLASCEKSLNKTPKAQTNITTKSTQATKASQLKNLHLPARRVRPNATKPSKKIKKSQLRKKALVKQDKLHQAARKDIIAKENELINKMKSGKLYMFFANPTYVADGDMIGKTAYPLTRFMSSTDNDTKLAEVPIHVGLAFKYEDPITGKSKVVFDDLDFRLAEDGSPSLKPNLEYAKLNSKQASSDTNLAKGRVEYWSEQHTSGEFIELGDLKDPRAYHQQLKADAKNTNIEWSAKKIMILGVSELIPEKLFKAISGNKSLPEPIKSVLDNLGAKAKAGMVEATSKPDSVSQICSEYACMRAEELLPDLLKNINDALKSPNKIREQVYKALAQPETFRLDT